MVTRVSSLQIKDGGIQKEDINTTKSGQALITNVKAGSGITIEETGVDEGTGEVTIHSTGTASFSYRKLNNGESLVIPEEQQMAVHGVFTMKGDSEIKIEGELVIANG